MCSATMIVGRFVVAVGMIGMIGRIGRIGDRDAVDPMYRATRVGDRTQSGIGAHGAGANGVMEGGDGGADPCSECVAVVGRECRSGREFRPGCNRSNGFAERESPCLGHGVEHALKVIGIGEVGEMHSGCVARLAGSQTYPAARSGCRESCNNSEHGATRTLVRSDVEPARSEQQQVGGSGEVRCRRMERELENDSDRETVE